ncbi:MAG: hypothetical protein ACI9BO_000027 [Zhongshania sp.]|jgi:hypothetical protein
MPYKTIKLTQGVVVLAALMTLVVAPMPLAAETCAKRGSSTPNENPEQPTGGVGGDGDQVFTETPPPSDSENSAPRATTSNETFQEGDETCGAPVGESSGNQAQTTLMTLNNRINSFRSYSRNNKSTSNSQTSAFGFAALGGAASAGNALLDESRLSVFGFTDYSVRDRQTTAFGSGYDQKQSAFTLGFDYRLPDEGSFVGMSLSASDGDSELDNKSGGSEVSGVTLAVHGAKYWDNHFISGLLAYGIMDVDIARLSSTDSFTASSDGNYVYGDFTIGREYSFSGLRLTPTVRLLIMDGQINAYSERSRSGAGTIRSVDDQDIQSKILAFAVQGDYAFAMNWGVWMPSLRIEYLADLSDAYESNGQTLSDFDKSALSTFSDSAEDPDSSTISVAWGSTAQFKRGLAAYVVYERLFYHEYMSKYTATLGVRYELP